MLIIIWVSILENMWICYPLPLIVASDSVMWGTSNIVTPPTASDSSDEKIWLPYTHPLWDGIHCRVQLLEWTPSSRRPTKDGSGGGNGGFDATINEGCTSCTSRLGRPPVALRHHLQIINQSIRQIINGGKKGLTYVSLLTLYVSLFLGPWQVCVEQNSNFSHCLGHTNLPRDYLVLWFEDLF